MGQSMNLSPNDISRLIDAMEASTHLDTTETEQQHADDLIRRLVHAFDINNDRQFSLLP